MSEQKWEIKEYLENKFFKTPKYMEASIAILRVKFIAIHVCIKMEDSKYTTPC